MTEKGLHFCFANFSCCQSASPLWSSSNSHE